MITIDNNNITKGGSVTVTFTDYGVGTAQVVLNNILGSDNTGVYIVGGNTASVQLNYITADDTIPAAIEVFNITGIAVIGSNTITGE